MTEQNIDPRTAKRTRLWMTGFFLLCFLYFLPRPGEAAQDSRLDTVLAIVNHGTPRVDQYRWNALPDIIPYRGHYYAAKAPGQALVAVPVFAAYKGVLSLAGDGADAEKIGVGRAFHRLYFQFYMSQFLASMYTVAIPAVAFLLLFFWFLGYFSSSFRSRLILTFALGLATDYFSYAQLFYPHVSTAALLFGSFMLLYMAGRGEEGEPPRSKLEKRPALCSFLAGLCLGGALLFDHTAAVPGVAIGAYALIRVPWRMWGPLALGVLPALLVIAGYNLIAYHNIAITGYSTRESGIGGSSVGSSGRTIYPAAFWGLTFSPYRGLFFMSPFLLLAVPGFVYWAKRGGREWLVALGASLLLFAFISTIYFWHGGAAVGPRYLVPVMPFIALPVIFVLDRVKAPSLRIGIYILILASALNVWLQTIAAKGYPLQSVTNPLFDVAIPDIRHGNVALSLGSILLAPFTGIYSDWTVLPLLVMLLLWTWLCFRSTIQWKPSILRRNVAGYPKSTSS
jgi:hypothetical protein